MSGEPAAASLSPSAGVAWAVLATAAFLAAVRLASAVVRRASDRPPSPSPRRQTTMLITGAAVGQFAFLVLLAVFLRWRGESFRELGWDLPAPAGGWIAAAVFTLAFVAFLLIGPLRGRAPLGEISAFHIYNSLLAGIAAGFGEEICFRGLVMTRMQQGGWGMAAQVVASAILFGLAHAAWGGISGKFRLRLFLPVVTSTAFVGACYAGIYLASHRSLLPVVTSHVVADMLIEPWLILASLSGTLGRTSRS